MAGHDNIPTLAEQVSRVPTQPGCYLWKDAKGDVIYVGKAKKLAFPYAPVRDTAG